MHLFVAFFDYFLCDGTHGISKYGWRFIPLCILTSMGAVLPMGAVFGLNEDHKSLDKLHEACERHLLAHGMDISCFKRKMAHAPHAPPVAPHPPSSREWAAANMHNWMYPPEWEEFLVELLRDGATGEVLKALIPALKDASVMHTDGGSAFPLTAKAFDRSHTLCSKHMASKFKATSGEVKDVVERLLYNKHTSVSRCLELRNMLFENVATNHNLASDTKKRILALFSDEALPQTSQAFRNFIFTHIYSATVLLEAMFGHIKTSETRNTLKHGLLYDVIMQLFAYVDVRIQNLARKMEKPRQKQAWMDVTPEGTKKNKDKKDSTLTRWKVGG
jgi:hypothetical protein